MPNTDDDPYFVLQERLWPTVPLLAAVAIDWLVYSWRPGRAIGIYDFLAASLLAVAGARVFLSAPSIAACS